jgi:tetratricopeptide (TPR) repeat protein
MFERSLRSLSSVATASIALTLVVGAATPLEVSASPAPGAAGAKARASARAAAAERGRVEYETAARLFDAEEFEAALPYFERAHSLSGGRPATVLGLAQCLRALKRYDAALTHFEAYLATAPANAAEVEETVALVRTLKAHADAKAAEAERIAEAARVAEVERAAEAARVAEARHVVASPAIAASASSPLAVPLAPAPPPPPPPAVSDSVFSSPWFWAVAGVLAASGGATAAIVASRGVSDPYAGTSGVLLVPSR